MSVDKNVVSEKDSTNKKLLYWFNDYLFMLQ